MSQKQASADRFRASPSEGGEGLSQDEFNSIQDQVDGVFDGEGITPANGVLEVTKWLIRKIVLIAAEAIAAAPTETSAAHGNPQDSSARDGTAASTTGLSPPASDINMQDEQSSRRPELADPEPIIFKDWHGCTHILPFEQFKDFGVSTFVILI